MTETNHPPTAEVHHHHHHSPTPTLHHHEGDEELKKDIHAAEEALEGIANAVGTTKEGVNPPSTPTSHNSSQADLEAGEGGEKAKTKKEIVLQDQTNLLPTRQVILVFCGLSISLFCTLIDQTIISTALPQIGKVFGNTEQISWVANSYLLTSTAFQPLYGRFSDIFGRKFTLLAALAIFFLGSLLCAVSQSLIQLIVFRAIAGMGGGGILTLVMIIVSDVVSLKERGKYQGITGVVVALSNSLGPLLGGVFTDTIGWRWCFWINLILVPISAVVVIFLLPLKRVRGNMKEKLKKIDYLGSLLTLAGTICLLLPISWGGTEYSWSSAAVLVPLILGFAIIGVFIWVEMKVPLPIVPMSLFKVPTVVGVFTSTLLSGVIFYGQLYYLPQYFQEVKGTSSIRSGVLLLGLILPQTFFSFSSGILVSRTGEYKISLVAGFVIWTIGLGLLSYLNVNSSLGFIIGFQVLAGCGAGQTFQTGMVAAQAAVPRAQMAVVTGARNFFRLVGGTVGLAIAQALLNNAVSSKLTSDGFSESLKATIVASPTTMRSLGLSATQLSQAIEAYTIGIQHVWYLCIPCAGLSVFLTVFLVKKHDLNRADDKVKKAEGKEWADKHKLSSKQREALQKKIDNGEVGEGEKGIEEAAKAVQEEEHGVKAAGTSEK